MIYYKPYYITGNGMTLIFPASRKFNSIQDIINLIPNLLKMYIIRFQNHGQKYRIYNDNSIIIIETSMPTCETNPVMFIKGNSDKWINL